MFAGPRGGLTAPLTWGQRAIWEVVNWLGPQAASLNLLEICPVDGGTGRTALAEALRRLVERHESLRTRFTDTEDGPEQLLTRAGTLTFAVHESLADDRDATVRRVARELSARAFTPRELPLRAAAVAEDGVITTIVLVVSHLAVDGWSIKIVRQELLDALRGADLPPLAQQPVERARWEQSAPARARERAAFDHWAAATREVPRIWLEALPRTGPDDLLCSEIASPALGRAVGALAGRYRLTRSMVVQAGTALALGRALGENDVALRLIVATRYTAETTRFVGPFNQNALLRIRLHDESAGEFLARVRRAALAALSASEYDPVALEELVAATAAERGFPADGYCFVNDVGSYVPPGAAARAAEQAPGTPDDSDPDSDAAALAGVVTDRPPLTDPKGANLFLYVHELGARTRLSVVAHRGFLPPGGTTRFLRDLEWLLLEADRTGAGPAALARAYAARHR
ncbi:condensation domain-containing protein [Peterkaempfera bronchialis]|uniref:condensation domain-containing protein n=1 Tax=Peterkaempfera bronchialis TaxID=2126346 RepID=UPI003C2D32C6